MLTRFPDPAYHVPLPRHTGGLALYLDFDGVLHPESVYRRPGGTPYLVDAPGHALFEHCQLLESVLLPYPRVKIVMSTSWVQMYDGSVAKVARRLTPDLRARVVGATFNKCMNVDAFKRESRGTQIWSDVLRRQPEAWVALDDDYIDWPAHCVEHLVRTHPVLGISPPVVLAELRAKLAAMYQQE
ncbi:UNVERIFIED_ORG: hypothetical protein BDU10_2499 [Burkholderia sp. CF145]